MIQIIQNHFYVTTIAKKMAIQKPMTNLALKSRTMELTTTFNSPLEIGSKTDGLGLVLLVELNMQCLQFNPSPA